MDNRTSLFRKCRLLLKGGESYLEISATEKHLYLLLDKQLPVISHSNSVAKTSVISLPIKSGNLKCKYNEPLLQFPLTGGWLLLELHILL